MTKYLDEYNPNSRGLSYRAQADASKLKFNNILSCIAVVLVPVGSVTMAGIHLTTSSTNNLAELKLAMAELKAAINNQKCDAYMVATFGFHAGTQLHAQLKKVARAVYLCDVQPDKDNQAQDADVDVKFELSAGRMLAFVRQHARYLETRADGTAGRTPKPNWNAATAAPGKPRNLTDRGEKPWYPVAFKKLP